MGTVEPVRAEEAFRTKSETWPSIRVAIELCPWHWRLWAWLDDLTWSGSVEIGPAKVEFFSNWKRKR